MATGFQHVDCKHCSNRFNSVFCKTEHDKMEEIEALKICSTFKKGESIFKEEYARRDCYSRLDQHPQGRRTMYKIRFRISTKPGAQARHTCA